MCALSKKEKRAYQRLVTGLSIGNHKAAFMRFMTLTTAPGVTRDINKDFDTLKKRIGRANQHNDGFYGFKFNRYFKLKTAEGPECKVLHIIYWGRFIPQAWLSKAWTQIHQSPIVDIRACWGHKTRNVKGLAGYLLTNYLTKQPIIRMSYGWKWAWLGFCKSWEHIKKTGEIRRSADNSTPIWNDCVKHHTTKHYWAQYWSFKKKYRKVAKENWAFLMKDPLPTTRQLRWCNPDRSRINKKLCRSQHQISLNNPLIF